MRIALLALAVLVAGTAAQAQSPSFGLKAGLNVANISFDDDGIFDDIPGIDKQPRLGFVGGVTADVPFSSSLGLRAEVLYSQKGYAISYDAQAETVAGGGSFDGTLTAQVDYLEVPVLLNVMFPMENGLEIGLQAGLAPAFKLSTGLGCSGFEDAGGCDDFVDEDETDFDTIKSFDLGGALGLTVGAGPFAVDARYTMSIPTIDEDQDPDNAFFEPVDARHGVVSITGVYRFGR